MIGLGQGWGILSILINKKTAGSDTIFIFLIFGLPYAKHRSFLIKTERAYSAEKASKARSDTTILVILSAYGGLAHFSGLSGLGAYMFNPKLIGSKFKPALASGS